MAKKRSRKPVKFSVRPRPNAPSITRPRSEFARKIDWGGVYIVPPDETVTRLLPGGGKKAQPVRMDLRGFVPSRPSTVISKWVEAELAQAVKQHDWLEPLVHGMRHPKSFDTVANLLADAVFDKIDYRLRGGAAWQLPEETLARGHGDCEDRATLLASALVAAGVSPYNVRVALGVVHLSRHGKSLGNKAHAWVVYRAEDGGWLTLEPVPDHDKSKHPALGFEYEPHFVFNGDHKWSFMAEKRPRRGERWNELDPTFHGEVHKSIVLQAAAQANVPAPLRSQLARTFTTLFGNVIDNPDLRFQSYHPRDHFDSGVIDEAWATVVARLQRFYASPLTDADGVNNLCWALHALADFYAHSTYAHFLKLEKGTLIPYDPSAKTPALRYDYANDPTFSKVDFSHYDAWWKPSMFDRLARWNGRPISGRYSLHGDSQDVFERLTNAPPDSAFPNAAARQFVGSLPHHNEIAVDEEVGSNKLYGTAAFKEQFAWRYHLALNHMVAALKKHPQIG
ncbi:MAG TPA: transglutaminase domain-containing protein [Polyangiaceae bacterium]